MPEIRKVVPYFRSEKKPLWGQTESTFRLSMTNRPYWIRRTNESNRESNDTGSRWKNVKDGRNIEWKGKKKLLSSLSSEKTLVWVLLNKSRVVVHLVLIGLQFLNCYFFVAITQWKTKRTKYWAPQTLQNRHRCCNIILRFRYLNIFTKYCSFLVYI